MLYLPLAADHGLRVREAREGADVDVVRHPRVPRARDHPEQGLQQGRGLVGAGRAHVRDGGRVPALLRGPAHPDIREDRRRKGKRKC